jgi:hypothetical protein
VLLVHHSGKEALRGLRGHSSLLAALDVAIEVVRDGDLRLWKMAKAKEGDDEAAEGFRLDVVELGTDADGEPVTSCVVREDLTIQQQARLQRKEPTGAHQKAVLAALRPLFEKSPHQGKADAPAGRPCIDLEAAIEAAAPHLTCEPKRRPERARQAITAMVAAGHLKHLEGWLWLP